jgi:multidrug efflux pump subunit AcrB
VPRATGVKQDEVPGADIAALRGVQIRPANTAETVPLDQVIDGVAVRWEDPIIWRRDRKRTITLQANPIRGVTLPTYMESVAPQFATLASELPPGYRMDWGGEYETSTKSQASLIPGIVPAVGIMLIIRNVLAVASPLPAARPPGRKAALAVQSVHVDRPAAFHRIPSEATWPSRS